MKLFFRKYLLINIYTIAIYFLLFSFRNNDADFLNIHLFICILIGLLIRLIDDYLDYEKDLDNNKAIFKKKTLLILIILSFCISSILFFVSRSYLYFILLILFVISLIKCKLTCYIKAIYIPLMIFCISYYCFGLNVFYILITILFFMGDIYLIYKKR